MNGTALGSRGLSPRAFLSHMSVRVENSQPSPRTAGWRRPGDQEWAWLPFAPPPWLSSTSRAATPPHRAPHLETDVAEPAGEPASAAGVQELLCLSPSRTGLGRRGLRDPGCLLDAPDPALPGGGGQDPPPPLSTCTQLGLLGSFFPVDQTAPTMEKLEKIK